MIVLRLLGYLFAIAAIGSVGYDLARSIAEGMLTLTPFGEVWYHVAPASLNVTQAFIQRYLWPPLWSDGIVHLLHVPGWITFTILAFILLYIAGPVTGKYRD